MKDLVVKKPNVLVSKKPQDLYSVIKLTNVKHTSMSGKVTFSDDMERFDHSFTKEESKIIVKGLRARPSTFSSTDASKFETFANQEGTKKTIVSEFSVHNFVRDGTPIVHPFDGSEIANGVKYTTRSSEEILHSSQGITQTNLHETVIFSLSKDTLDKIMRPPKLFTLGSAANIASAKLAKVEALTILEQQVYDKITAPKPVSPKLTKFGSDSDLILASKPEVSSSLGVIDEVIGPSTLYALDLADMIVGSVVGPEKEYADID